MKRHITLLTLLLGCTLATLAVTDREMEQARTEAARLYLRWANDGSGYLDALSPTTMGALEKNLKTKEKENLRAFKAVKTPAGYNNWTKEQLVQYWGTEFFSSPGLNPAGVRAKDRVRRRVAAMKVSAPAAAEKKAEPKVAAVPKAAGAPAKAVAELPAPKPTGDDGLPIGAEAAAAAETAAAKAVAETETEIIQTAAMAETEPVTPRRNSHTGVYITILAILVAVVVGLVVFASRVLKTQPRRDNDSDDEPDPATGRATAPTVSSAPLVAPETGEWRSRARQAEAERDALEAECNRQRDELDQMRQRLDRLEKTASAAVAVAQTAPAVAEPQAEPEPVCHAPRQQVAVIYLGRANNKGIFVRADRNLKPEASVFRLETTDGFAGTYRVAEDAEVWERALADPAMILGGGCTSPELDDTQGKSRVVTESAGTAIFEGGCWKVIRKAKVTYR